VLTKLFCACHCRVFMMCSHFVRLLIIAWALLSGALSSEAKDLPSKEGPPTGTSPARKPETPKDYTSIRHFPGNLRSNALALFSHPNIAPFLIGGIVSGALAFEDHGIRNSWSIRDRDSAFGKTGSLLGGITVVGPAVAGLFVAGHCSKKDRFHSFAYSLAQATTINLGLTEGLKCATRRIRPSGNSKMSFPSGHSSSAFAIAAVVQGYYGRNAGIFGYGVAGFISASRVRANKHWASDVAVGATIGYLVGSSVCRRTGISLRVGKVLFLPSVDTINRRFGLQFIRRSI
jgi:membrane-associated phospholipid phosphatase